MVRGQFSGKSIDELKKVFAEAVDERVPTLVMGGDFKQSRVGVEDRYTGITDLEFWVYFADSLVEIACDILDTMPNGGGASVLELEILKLLLARRIDCLIDVAKEADAAVKTK